jgi:glutamine amidotransferase
LPKVSIVNYGVGNLRSVKQGLEKSGGTVRITNHPKILSASDAIVLPGVGAFTAAAKNLAPLSATLRQVIDSGTPILGICLGLQLLFTDSMEGGSTDGLNLISGRVAKLPASVKIPQMGWNTLDIVQEHPLMEDVKNNSYFYFVHSYFPQPSDAGVIVATTQYGVRFPSVIAKQNVFATQFHPEKSSSNGLTLLRNFITLSKR